MTAHAASGQPRRNSVISTVPSEDLAGPRPAAAARLPPRLEAEEDKVSYWRRLAHARIDVLEAQSGHGGTLLAVGPGAGAGRHGVRARAGGRWSASSRPTRCPSCRSSTRCGAPPRPATTRRRPTDAVEGLRTAERQLTDYRHALHERIDEATRELILRYRDDPRAALTLIPQE